MSTKMSGSKNGEWKVAGGTRYGCPLASGALWWLSLRKGCRQESPDGHGPSKLGSQGVGPTESTEEEEDWDEVIKFLIPQDRDEEQLPSEQRQLTTMRDVFLFHHIDDILLTSEFFSSFKSSSPALWLV